MTKRRPPLSYDAALARIAGQLPAGWDEMAVAASRAVRTVRNWGDPDTPEQVPLDCAELLDLAYQRAGGDGAPLFEAYAARLKFAAGESFATGIVLARATASSIRESGQAHAALIVASQPDATEADQRTASREADEALEALHRTKSLLAQAQGP